MRLLFDQNVPAPLARLLPEHEVSTADRMGWSELSNGVLLAAAEAAGFAVMVTADKNIRHQQNLAGRTIGILVLPTQNMAVLRAGLAELKTSIERAGIGAYHGLILPRPPLLRRLPPQ